MKKVVLFSVLLPFLMGCKGRDHYLANQSPISQTNFIKLLLGSIKPKGWLADQLMIQDNGLTGHLDEFWLSIKNSDLAFYSCFP